MTEIDNHKVDFIKTLKKDDYKLYYSYHRIEDVQEVIRGWMGLPCSDTPKPVRIEGIDCILFATKANGLIAQYVCIQNKDMFDLYEMPLPVYNRYEEYISEFWVFEF